MFKNFKITNKGLYWGLIITFGILYLCVGFVSTLHSITFFNLANDIWLAVLLGLTYELGQASVLFGLLMTKNNQKFLPWALMFLLTALQVTANVYASFKFMATSGSTDYMFWQKSILFGVQATSPEMYQVIISWIAGALLPVVALGMTALVTQNIKFITEENEVEKQKKVGSIPDEDVTEIIDNEVNKKVGKILSETKIDDRSELIKFNDEFSDDFDETGIGGRDLTPKESQQLHDYLDEDVELLTPETTTTPSIEETHEKDLLVPEILSKKKLGRPPKQKETVAEPKKEQELLLNENVGVPQRQKRFVNPLKLKTKKIKPIKRLEEVIKPSKGDEVIALIEKMENAAEKEPIGQPIKSEVVNSESLLVPPELLSPYLDNGVEVIDAKAVSLKDKNKLKK